ncbi:MAG: M15 family metallopeptidase [Pseudomonadota bacterium]
MSKRIEDLHPLVGAKAKEHLLLCEESKIPVILWETSRTSAEQAARYARGRTENGPPCIHNGTPYAIGSCSKHPRGLTVTQAPPGYSYHEYDLAYDLVTLRRGVPAWIENLDLDNDGIPDYREIAELGESVGMYSMGLQKGWDWPHFQMSFGLSIKDLLAGKKITPDGKNG